MLVSVKGHIVSKETMPSAPRLDARWIRKRDPTELNASLGALARTFLPAWHLDVHAHRAALTEIVRESTEAVGATKVKLHKPYVSFEVVAISRLRSRFLKRKSHFLILVRVRILRVWLVIINSLSFIITLLLVDLKLDLDFKKTHLGSNCHDYA